jgi:hypothetical protein
VLRSALRVVTRWLRVRGGPTARAGAPGSVTVIQRFGSTLNLSLHFHALLLDGLFVGGPSGTPPRFQRTRRWTQDDVDCLVVDIATWCELRAVVRGPETGGVLAGLERAARGPPVRAVEAAGT